MVQHFALLPGMQPQTVSPPVMLLPKLRELGLGHSTFHDKARLLLQLTALSWLTRLDMESVSISNSQQPPQQQLTEAVAKLLQHLPLLQHLSLRGMKLGAEAASSICSLQHLQHFDNFVMNAIEGIEGDEDPRSVLPVPCQESCM